MDIFFSWSGNPSKALAEVFREWLPAVIQAIKPYFTPDDLSKGTQWNSEISKKLESCRIGLIFLTPDNYNAPWIMFEAGALSKHLDKSRVCPILFDITPTDITGPLTQFQLTEFHKDDIKKLVVTINGQLDDTAIPANTLDKVFETWWPELDTRIKKELSQTENGVKRPKIRPDRDVLEEILARVRMTTSPKQHISQNALNALVDSFLHVFEMTLATANGENLLDSLARLSDPISYLIDRLSEDQELRNRMRYARRELVANIEEIDEATLKQDAKFLVSRGRATAIKRDDLAADTESESVEQPSEKNDSAD
jgi:hypothetical protein